VQWDWRWTVVVLVSSVLRASLLADDVEQVVAVVRTPTQVQHPNLRQATLADLSDLLPIEAKLQGADACFYCTGLSPLTKDEAVYTRVNHDPPAAAASALAKINPELTFVYVSGADTSTTGTAMWARVRARTENVVLDLFPNGYVLRPGLILPPVTSPRRPSEPVAVPAVEAPPPGADADRTAESRRPTRSPRPCSAPPVPASRTASSRTPTCDFARSGG
jgi:uncharacterized protein YbjT (DUF2867 family)